MISLIHSLQNPDSRKHFRINNLISSAKSCKQEKIIWEPIDQMRFQGRYFNQCECVALLSGSRFLNNRWQNKHKPIKGIRELWINWIVYGQGITVKIFRWKCKHNNGSSCLCLINTQTEIFYIVSRTNFQIIQCKRNGGRCRHKIGLFDDCWSKRMVTRVYYIFSLFV